MYDRLRSENGKKTEKARNALISLIRDRKLQPGDKLPNQKELIQCLGLSATTVIRAVNALKGSGSGCPQQSRGISPESGAGQFDRAYYRADFSSSGRRKPVLLLSGSGDPEPSPESRM